MSDKQEGQYLIQVQKVTNIGSGESISISTNLPRSASKETLLAEIQKILWVTEERLIEANERVLRITEATKDALDGLIVEKDKVN